ncbi:Suf-domain-containing protein [Mycena polygramma]|nr:Suf-domain-containing protein [Mycena polygramma]
MRETLHRSNGQSDAATENSTRISPSDYDALITQLKEYPHDPDSWKRLVHIAETSSDIVRIRDAYDALIKRYPNTASAQTAYIKHFVNSPASHGEAEDLLSTFLKASPSSDLWKFYLDYVQHVNSGPETYEIIRNAYDFALDHIGQDRDSGSIWADYIQFLHAAGTTTPCQAEQKTDALRKIYQRAIQIPLDNTEQLWMQYEEFENSFDKTTAKKFMSDLSPAHMQARIVLRQLSTHLGGLDISDRCGIFLPAPATFSKQESQLVKRWKAYLRWEEGNPLEIKDRGVLDGRVEKAYRKAVIRMRYYPEIWFLAFSWTASIGKNEEAVSILKAGLEPNPDSFVLTYAYAELLEKMEQKKVVQRDFTEIHRIYESFFGVLRANLARLAAAAFPPDTPADDVNAPLTQDVKHLQEEFAEGKKQYSNAWINYMRFARRAQGHKACRDAFGKARREEHIAWEVYKAAAMTEYHCNFEDGRAVAARIFESGMKKFAADVSYILAHLNFLLTINDQNNSLALFERVIGRFTPQEAKPIWDLWSQSRYQYDDLEAGLELEQRIAKVYPNDSSLKLFAQRHSHYNIDAIADHDLGIKFMGTRTSSITPSVPPPIGVKPIIIPDNANGNRDASSSKGNKRPLPPSDREHEIVYKRVRPDELDRNKDRFSQPPSASAPSSRFDAAVKPAIPPRRNEQEGKTPQLPSVIRWFLTQLPPPEAFDGPTINVDMLTETLRTVVIPPTARACSPSSPPPPRQARLPPDYGPYQGPRSMPARREVRRY